MSIPRTVQVGPLAVSIATGYAAAQAGTGGTALVLNGSLVVADIGTPDKPRRLIITSAGDDSGITFTITGRMVLNGPIVTEVMTGANAAAATNLQAQAWSMLDYAQVISITPSGNTAGNVTAGTNGVASSSWIRLDNFSFAPVAFEALVSGTVNYTIEEAMRDPNITYPGGVVSAVAAITPAQLQWLPHATVASKTASAVDQWAQVPTWTRCTLNSQTNPGFVTFTASQPVSGLHL